MLYYAILVIRPATRVGEPVKKWVQHGKETQCGSCAHRLFNYYTDTMGRATHEVKVISFTDVTDKYMQIDTFNDDLHATMDI